MNDLRAGWLTPIQKMALPDLKAEAARLEIELEAVKAEIFEREEAPKLQAIATARNIMRAHQLDLSDVFPGKAAGGADDPRTTENTRSR